MIHPQHLKELIIAPVLHRMGRWWQQGVNSPAAVNLLIGTAFQESLVGNQTCLKQLGGGPALGIYQIEPATHEDIWENYLAHRPGKYSFIRGLAGQGIDATEPFVVDLIGNLHYQTAIARLKYWRRSFSWPSDPNNLEALGEIWNTHYNANPSAGTTSDFINSFPENIL